MSSKPQRLNPYQKKALLRDRLRKKIAIKQGNKKICLTMIVKNESKNMVRLLDSIKSIIDMISIVDTGSTDNTEQIILEWGKKHNIPTTVHHEPFKNFSYNRTHSFQMAKKTYPQADYMLLSDADFVWEVNKGGKFDKVLLVDHKYMVEQYNTALSYWNIRLLSSKVDWVCVGVTHEYWVENKDQTEYRGEIRQNKITTLVIDDREDGGCKEDKFERDERLLREGLDDPKTTKTLKTRYKFYLAQTLKDLGRHDESIVWYKERVLDNGWPEEVYYSKFQIGFNYERLGWNKKQAIALIGKANRTDQENELLNKLNPKNLSPPDLLNQSIQDFADAETNYMDAYEYRKTRGESLYYLARMCRCLGMYDKCYNLIKKGKEIKYPEHDSLFIERGCYDFLWDSELSIVCYYLADKKDEGRKVLGQLLQRNDVPDWVKRQCENNAHFYI